MYASLENGLLFVSAFQIVGSTWDKTVRDGLPNVVGNEPPDRLHGFLKASLHTLEKRS